MNYLPITLFAYLLNALALTIDKFLLTKAFPNPLLYIFYINTASLLSLLLLPFTHLPEVDVFILASLSTIFWTLGAYFMFAALKTGQVSRVVPAIATLTPLFLLIYAKGTGTLTINETWAAGILILGLIFTVMQSLKGKIGKGEIVLEILAALFFAISYLVLREAYLKENFLTVLVYSRFILIPALTIIILLPNLRRQLKLTSPHLKAPSAKLFIGGQILGGSSQLLLTFAISLVNPTLVNALGGVQYVFVFALSILLSSKFPQIFKERFSFTTILSKALGIIFLGLGLYILAQPATQPTFGVTFSPKFASELNLNPQTVYISLLDDLKVKFIRLPIYWDEVEKIPNKFNFGKLDFYLTEAQKRDVKVILVLGLKQPRWPECFAPPWVAKTIKSDRESKTLNLITKEVEYFKKFPNIWAWQVENEPLLSYGLCDPVNDRTINLLKKEVAIVRRLDPRPVLITDSGELGLWIEPQKLSDLFGTTLYRIVWDKYLGYVDYPFPPVFYRLKNDLTRLISAKNSPTIISELQTEPWINNRAEISKVTLSDQVKLFPLRKLKDHVAYTKEIGFPQVYLWGVEWWYFLSKNGYPEYWEYVRGLF